MDSWKDPELVDRARHIETLIRHYFDRCNAADRVGIVECFTADAVHYFPPGMYNGPFCSASAIAEKFADMVETIGSFWTVDMLLVEPLTWRAVMEWTHFKTVQGTVLRGIEVYEFDPRSRLISEIRAYYASPQQADLKRQELQGFHYEQRAYPLAPPPGVR